MKRNQWILLLVLVAASAISGNLWAELQLSDKPGPNQFLGETPKEVYGTLTFSAAVESLRFIDREMTSFRELTTKTSKSLSERERREFQDRFWENQHLGYPNHRNVIEGTLKKQDYLIKKLEYELAKERLAGGKKIPAAEINRLKETYEITERELEKYLKNYQIAD